MNKSILLFVLVFVYNVTLGQSDITETINRIILQHEASAHLAFLAADEMRGRDAGSNELDIAANYIRTQFRINNIKPAPGTKDYFQHVDLMKSIAPAAATVTIGNEKFTLNENLVLLDGSSFKWEGEFIYVGYGAIEDLKKKDIKGKIVLALAGSREAENVNKVFGASRDKYVEVKKMGAAGLVEILALPQVPWPALVSYFSNSRWRIKEGESIPFVWIKPQNLKALSLQENQSVKGSMMINSAPPQLFPGRNVAAIVEGTDPSLKEEYIVLTAHYDHIGITREDAKADNIFNGARDNATGTTALIETAKFLSQFPPKRSVLIVAVTCEEKGLLGSQWYVKHPLVPLQKTVLNFNCDGVGYNDKRRVTSISLGRTNMDDLLTKAAEAYNFSIGGDPDPKEGFYERSDQVSFAKEGIPAIKLQPGLSQMDEEIFKYYHRPADEFESLDMKYLTEFYRTFVYAVHLVANDLRKPTWTPGDKFEAAARSLYGK